MKFERYKQRRDSQVLLESAGTNKQEIRSASKAIKEWVAATANMLEAVERLPEAFGELGGSVQTQNSIGQNTVEHELAMELQRVKYILQEFSLADLTDRLNQHQARIDAASHRLD